MPQNIDSRLFDYPPLFVFPSRGWQREGVPERLREACDHSCIVTSKIIQLDRFRNAVVCLRLPRSANENLLVVLSRISQMKQ